MISEQASTPAEIVEDFARAGFAKPNITRLRQQLSTDKRTIKKGKDVWTIKLDMLTDVDKKFDLTNSYNMAKKIIVKPLKNQSSEYIDPVRLKSIKEITNANYDFSRLIEMLDELNQCFEAENFIAVIFLLRAVLDHLPPIFNCKSFAEVSNNYSGTKSFKDSMKRLDESSRKIADSFLHTHIRKSESLPNRTQVDFTNDLDVLLAEIIRIIK
jgi:hypothetical protein